MEPGYGGSIPLRAQPPWRTDVQGGLPVDLGGGLVIRSGLDPGLHFSGTHRFGREAFPAQHLALVPTIQEEYERLGSFAFSGLPRDRYPREVRYSHGGPDRGGGGNPGHDRR